MDGRRGPQWRWKKKKNMKPQKTTTARPSVDLDATDEFPVLDAAAYAADILAREPDESSDSRATATECDPFPAGFPAADHRASGAAPPIADADNMLAVEHWIAQKADELRAHHDALSFTQRERAAAVARADELSRQLTETSANLEAVSARERALAETLTGEQEAARRRAAENEALIAGRELAVRGLSELETRLRDSEAREHTAQRTIEAQNHTHAELTHQVLDETRAREGLAAEVESLRAQLSNYVESLHSRESYRAIYESTLQELDAQLAAARLQTAEEQARANQLGAELQSRHDRLQDAVRERDEARHIHDTEITHHAAERGEGEQRRGALESRLAELTAQHADVCAQFLTAQATLTAAQHRAEADALAAGAAADRLRELESAVASRQAELTGARLEIERNRTLLEDLTAALLKSQTMFSEQGRLLEEREAAASTMAMSHAEQTALITMLRGQIAELTARLATPEAERRALEERVAALTREAAERDSRLSHLESMNSELRATVGQLNTSLTERDGELQRAGPIEHRRAGPHPDCLRWSIRPSSGRYPDTHRQRPEPQRGAARADDDRPRS
jgi:chromosome segregation ATPase